MMKHKMFLWLVVVFMVILAGCKSPTKEGNQESQFSIEYIDAHLSFENLPSRDGPGKLMFKVVVLGNDGVMPLEGKTTHMWLTSMNEPLEEIINIDTSDTTWFTPMTVGDTLSEFDDNFKKNSFTSLWYGLVAIGDTVSFELELAILDDVFCCGEQDSLYPYLSTWINEAGEHIVGNHSLSIKAGFMGDGLTRAYLTYYHAGHLPTTFITFKFNHISGQYAFNNPNGDIWTYGVGSLE